MYNPSRIISLYGGQRYRIEVPCGQCSECKQAKRTDVYYRTYYECLNTWNKKGYVLFDTLTYRNEDLPHISDFIPSIEKGSDMDFSTFNKEHIQLFFKRLRRQLAYHGYGKRDVFKYFYATEYGSEKYTARPHYHILFFVTGNIHPAVFSKMVYEQWKHGHTDGVNCKGLEYVMNKRVFGPLYNKDEKAMRAVCNYVSKYVTKDSDFEETLQKRINHIFSWKSPKYIDEYLSTWQGKKKYNEITKIMKPHHHWSNGFGEFGLDYNEEDLIYKGLMKVMSKDEVWQFNPLSAYLERKKYSETRYDDNGRLYWQLTDEGKKRAWDKSVDGLQNFVKRFNEWMLNIDNLIQKGDTYDRYDFEKEEWISEIMTETMIIDTIRDIKEKVVKYLDGRDPYLFGVYIQYYKGRIKSRKQIEREKQGIYRVDDIKEFFNKGLISKGDLEREREFDPSMTLYNYCHYTDVRHLGERLLSEVRLDIDVDGEKQWPYPGFEYGDYFGSWLGSFSDNWNKGHRHKVKKVSVWEVTNVIDENSDPRFKDFDKLYNLMISSLRWNNVRKQKFFDETEELRKKYKYLVKKES